VKPTEGITGLEQKDVPRPRALPALTGARFIAAASVVGYHYQSIVHCPAWLDPLLGSGRSGVCFFYILSGFILTYNYKSWFGDNTKRWKLFAEARLARVYPMYFVSMLLALAVVVGWDLPRYRSLLEESSYAHLATGNMIGSFLANTLCLQPFMPSPEVELLWNPANWSIPCELFFYLCFPAFLVWLNKRRMTRRSLIVTAATIYAIQSVVFVTIAATIARYWTPTSLLGRFTATRYLATDLIVYRSPILRFGEFAVGVIVCLLFLEERERGHDGVGQSWKRTAGILLCLLGIVFVASVDVPSAWIHAVTWLRAFTLFTPLYAMLILLLAQGGTPFARVLSWRPIELLGESSYSLYLIHTPILTIPLYKLRSGHALSGIEIAGYLAATLIASIACFKWIETPARKKWRALALKSSLSSTPGARQTA
jgi:peptidoglycan/LPS O-acetylase OafA/YrhL